MEPAHVNPVQPIGLGPPRSTIPEAAPRTVYWMPGGALLVPGIDARLWARLADCRGEAGALELG